MKNFSFESFTIDYLACALLISLLLAAYLIKKLFFPYQPSPSLAFSDVQALNVPSKRLKFLWIPRFLYLCAFICLSLAFLDPHTSSSRKYPPARAAQTIPKEGLAIYLILDHSGSMGDEVVSKGTWGHKRTLSKLDLLKETTEQFILSRPSDLIGVVAFARTPQVLAPLTLDQDVLLTQIQQLQTTQNPEENGSAIGYAIYKTAHLIAATRHFAQDLQRRGEQTYDIKNALMIVVTDGFQDPNRLDYGNRLRTIELDEAADYAKSQGIRLYIINLDPQFASAEFAPHRRQMKKLAEMTGGHLYLVSHSQDLQQIFETINHLEKETIPPLLSETAIQITKRRFSLYPYLIALGLTCLMGAIVLESTVLRTFP